MIDAFADVRYDDAFGPALSVVDAFRRVRGLRRRSRRTGTRKGAARVVALGRRQSLNSRDGERSRC